MSAFRRTGSRRALLAFCLSCLTGMVHAQVPAQPPIRILVGAPAGGTTDTMARTLAQSLGSQLGRVVVVDNRPGAGGNIAAEAVAKAAPDGNTLLMSFTSHAINASLYPRLPFDPLKDFTPLTMVSTSPSVLVAHPRVPANTVRALIDLAKARPGQLNFAIGAMGSSLHLAGDAFKMKAGVYIVNIPYRGTAPAVQDVLAGQVELMFAAVGNVQQHIRAGKLKALGVTSAQRSSVAPDLPTVAESGLSGYEAIAWNGLLAPTGTPKEVIARLNTELKAVLESPDIRQRFEAQGFASTWNTPAAYGSFLQSEVDKWAKVVKASGAKID